MLVISRKPKESFMIGDNIEVVILESKDGAVKVGINAPKEMKVYRREIFEEIKNENKEALNADIDILRKIMDADK